MKKVLTVICALFVSVAFAGVTLAAEHEKEMKPATDNTMKMTPEKKDEAKPAEKK